MLSKLDLKNKVRQPYPMIWEELSTFNTKDERFGVEESAVEGGKLWQEENLRPAQPGYLSIRIHDLKHTFGRSHTKVTRMKKANAVNIGLSH